MNWRGKPLTTYRTVIELIAATTTTTGLRVEANLNEGYYPTGEKISNADFDALPITRHDFHGDWNYTVTRYDPSTIVPRALIPLGAGRAGPVCSPAAPLVRQPNRHQRNMHMCGIVGAVGLGLPGGIRNSLELLRHRGPDVSGSAQGMFGDRWSWQVGHTRLSINDLSEAGNQPLISEDSTIELVFNGEIYNSPALRAECEAAGHRFRSRSDGEVIVHLWEMQGERCLARLNGIFAMALVDHRCDAIVLARDPIGVKPLLYSTNGDALWFASELRALAGAGAPLGSLDLISLAQFLTFLWVPDPRTPYEGARTLEPGHMLRWSEGALTNTSFADLVADAESEPRLELDEAQSQVGPLVRSAVQRQLLSDVPLAVMASGGIDSSLIWQAAGGAFSKAYTLDWGSDMGNERLHEDTDAVRTLEAALATPVATVGGEEAAGISLPLSGDLFGDPAFELTRRIARQAQEDGFKVLFSGQGGDEVFGGYRRHVMAPILGRLPVPSLGATAAARLLRLPGERVAVEYAARVSRALTEPDELAAYMQLCTYSSARDRAIALGCTEAEVRDEVVWQRHRAVHEALPRHWSRLQRLRTLDLLVYLPGLGLAYADRAGMEFGIEVRVPLLDLELVRWSLRLPDRALVHRGKTKVLARGLAERVLPPEIVRRRKRGFGVPIDQVKRTHGVEGSRGFRQGSYFARARRVLQQYCAEPPVPA